jgi:hypothetical protein
MKSSRKLRKTKRCKTRNSIKHKLKNARISRKIKLHNGGELFTSFLQTRLKPNTKGIRSTNRIDLTNALYPHGNRLLQFVKDINWHNFNERLPSPDGIPIVLDSTPYAIFGGAAFEIYGSVYSDILDINNYVTSTADIDVMVNVQMNRPLYLEDVEVSIANEFLTFLTPLFNQLKKDVGYFFETIELVIEDIDRVRINISILDSKGVLLKDHAVEFLMMFYYSKDPYVKKAAHFEYGKYDNDKFYRCAPFPPDFEEEDKEGEPCDKVKTYSKVLETISIKGFNVVSLWSEVDTTVLTFVGSRNINKDYDKNISRIGRIKFGLQLLLILFIEYPRNILISHFGNEYVTKNIQKIIACHHKIDFIGFKPTKNDERIYVNFILIFELIYKKYHLVNESPIKERYGNLVKILLEKPRCAKFLDPMLN